MKIDDPDSVGYIRKEYLKDYVSTGGYHSKYLKYKKKNDDLIKILQ